MIRQSFLILTTVSFWVSLAMALIVLVAAVHFWLKHSDFNVTTPPLDYYPSVTIIVPAHNEEKVIAQTTKAILDLNYPQDKVNIMIFADNCSDKTYQRALEVKNYPDYRGRHLEIISRTGTGGKAGVLNDALKLTESDYICVYDADAMPEKNALYFLIKKILENPERHVAAFGRNKTRNANQNFLTKCINQEILVSQRIQHCGLWHLFKIGLIPGTNFLIQTEFIKSIGGWRDGALTEDTDISFKIMQEGKLIALAYNSEAFEQEPETLSSYMAQRKRWAKGNFDIVFSYLPKLFSPFGNWRVKVEIFYFACTFLWFNMTIVISDFMFLVNLTAMALRPFLSNIYIPFTFDGDNIYIAQLLLFNWILMILFYLLQVSIATATQFGQATTKQIWIALLAYFTYSQLFIIISISALSSLLLDKLLGRDGHKWVKTERF